MAVFIPELIFIDDCVVTMELSHVPLKRSSIVLTTLCPLQFSVNFSMILLISTTQPGFGQDL
jgi:hypothetical protein